MLLFKASQLLTQAFVLPFLLISAIPLLFMSILTITSAFAIISVRVLLVYMDLFIAFCRRGLDTSALKKRQAYDQRYLGSDDSSRRSPTSPTITTTRRTKSKTNITIEHSPTATLPLSISRSSHHSSSSSGHVFPSSQDRDFEGIGGWRIPDGDAPNTSDDDGTWLSFNKRLELPSPIYTTTVAPSSPGLHRNDVSSSSGKLAHRRTLTTTGALLAASRNPSHLTLSALRRSRSGSGFGLEGGNVALTTAPASMNGGGEGYFSLQPTAESMRSLSSSSSSSRQQHQHNSSAGQTR